MGQGNIIGYEINEKTCQISFYNEEMAEPETMEVDADNYQIPLVIGKLRDTWAYGKEAKRLASLKEGFTVNRLLDKSLAGEKIEFGEESYEAVWLLAKFIELSLQSFPKINGIVFSVPELTEELAQMLRGIAVRMNIDKRHIFIQDYKESFCNYLFYQPKELWQYEAALFCCDRNEIKAYPYHRYDISSPFLHRPLFLYGCFLLITSGFHYIWLVRSGNTFDLLFLSDIGSDSFFSSLDFYIFYHRRSSRTLHIRLYDRIGLCCFCNRCGNRAFMASGSSGCR